MEQERREVRGRTRRRGDEEWRRRRREKTAKAGERCPWADRELIESMRGVAGEGGDFNSPPSFSDGAADGGECSDFHQETGKHFWSWGRFFFGTR